MNFYKLVKRQTSKELKIKKIYKTDYYTLPQQWIRLDFVCNIFVLTCRQVEWL